MLTSKNMAQRNKKKECNEKGKKKKVKEDDIWEIGDESERLRIREFWIQLGEEERKALVKLEKEAVLRKMKEQQKQTCSCNVCGRRRSDLEGQLELLYNTYYDELENFAKMQISAPDVYTQHPHSHHYNHNQLPHLTDEDDEDELDEMYDDDDEDYVSDSEESGILEFGTSLTVKGGILTVADDFLKNDGQKFLNLMEQLAQRKVKVMGEEKEYTSPANENGDTWEEDYDDISNSDEYEEDEHLTDQQRMEEGRRMFQIFAAKMFEQRVLTAYREKAAEARAAKLVQELEEEEQQKKLKEKNKKLKAEKEREKQRALKQKQEAEKLQKQKEEEEKARIQKEDKLRSQKEISTKEPKKLNAKQKKQKLLEEKIRKEAEENLREQEEERERKRLEDLALIAAEEKALKEAIEQSKLEAIEHAKRIELENQRKEAEKKQAEKSMREVTKKKNKAAKKLAQQAKVENVKPLRVQQPVENLRTTVHLQVSAQTSVHVSPSESIAYHSEKKLDIASPKINENSKAKTEDETDIPTLIHTQKHVQPPLTISEPTLSQFLPTPQYQTYEKERQPVQSTVEPPVFPRELLNEGTPPVRSEIKNLWADNNSSNIWEPNTATSLNPEVPISTQYLPNARMNHVNVGQRPLFNRRGGNTVTQQQFTAARPTLATQSAPPGFAYQQSPLPFNAAMMSMNSHTQQPFLPPNVVPHTATLGLNNQIPLGNQAGLHNSNMLHSQFVNPIVPNNPMQNVYNQNNHLNQANRNRK
ncbi:salt tolerance down-regulator-domain-containing protein [Globomyces pollinis-pini]|nr:salt tolerance down-regulator-domain-containing protein [Globomyces pollinis-pini]